MGATPGKYLTRLLNGLRLARWRRLAEHAALADPAALRRLRAEARTERREIDRFLAAADERLALPAVGSDAMRRPAAAEWAWRPTLWRHPMARAGVAAPGTAEVLDEEASLYHDCRASEFSLRQERNLRDVDLAPFGLKFDVFHFDGSFLSLALKLPDAAAKELSTRQIVRVDADVALERPVKITMRLNVRHGPNTAEIIADVPQGSGGMSVEFDLAHSGIVEKRIERAWLDVIFIAPQMNEIVLRDLVVFRRPRAEL